MSSRHHIYLSTCLFICLTVKLSIYIHLSPHSLFSSVVRGDAVRRVFGGLIPPSRQPITNTHLPTSPPPPTPAHSISKKTAARVCQFPCTVYWLFPSTDLRLSKRSTDPYKRQSNVIYFILNLYITQ